jgi:hypothetical protein
MSLSETTSAQHGGRIVAVEPGGNERVSEAAVLHPRLQARS